MWRINQVPSLKQIRNILQYLNENAIEKQTILYLRHIFVPFQGCHFSITESFYEKRRKNGSFHFWILSLIRLLSCGC